MPEINAAVFSIVGEIEFEGFAKDYVSVEGVSVFPTSATIEEGQLLVVTATITPAHATYKDIIWGSSNTNIATVSDGIVTSLAEGSATITAETVDGGFTATCEVTVEEYAPAVYEALIIYNKDLQTVEHVINNIEVLDLTVEKELGGNSDLSFLLPYNSTSAAFILPGKYIKCEDQFYALENINKRRGNDGNPYLSVRASHIFFDIENLQANTSNAAYTKILPALQVLLVPYGITVTGLFPDHPLYDTVRYIEYEEGSLIIDCMKAIFKPYFATFRLDNLTLVVVPDVGELPDPGPAVEFEYSVNNQSIAKETDYSDIVTKLTVEGEGDVSCVVHAPQEIKSLYRMERERTISFGGVSNQSDLEFLANQYMKHKQLPFTTYRLSVAELKHISNIDEIYPGKNFEILLGQKAKVKDSEFEVDVESVIQKYSYMPLEKWALSSVIVGDLKPYDITFTEPKNEKGVPGVGGGGSNDPWSGFSEPERVCAGLFGIISTEEPDDEGDYSENCLWFKY